MIPPERVDDPSLQDQEPLCSYITIHKSNELRAKNKEVVLGFVRQVQEDRNVAAAIKKWAYLVFNEVLSSELSLEVTGKGEELYKAFFEYQILLSKGNLNKAHEYLARIIKAGMEALKLKDLGANTLKARGRGREGRGRGKQRPCGPHHEASGPRKNLCQAETVAKYSDASVSGSTVESGLSSVKNISAVQQGLPSTAAHVAGAEVTQPGQHSATRKRKARFQKSRVIIASDISEDDNSVSHRSKRIVSSPFPQLHDLPGVTYQVDKINRHPHPRDAIMLQRQSPLTALGPGDFDASNIKGGCGGRLPLNGPKHDQERTSGVATVGASSDFRGRKKEPIRDLQTRPTRRLRRASMSTPGISALSCNSRAQLVEEPIIRGGFSTIFTPPLTRGNVQVVSKTRRKRTRVESETGCLVSDENQLADSHESSGADDRSLRPFPKKVHDEYLRPAMFEGMAVSGVPCGAPPLEQTDQLLQDAASNALVILQEGSEPDVPDWTQDKDDEAECDPLCGDDQGETDDDQVDAVASAPSIVVLKPPLPATPCIWAQTRQEVCESFEHFRSYHSGVYSRDDIVKGYLLGAFAASRDTFHHDGKLIISHGGGKSESILDTRGGPRRYQQDQDQEASDKSVRALLKTWKDRLPIALLADDRYALFPYDLASAKYTYVVLGFYWISHAWAECQSARDGSRRIVRWKFAFQWCNGQGSPWWVPQPNLTDVLPEPLLCPTKSSSHPADGGGDPSIRCETCREHSPWVYKQGWMCLNPRCSVFWSINGEEPELLDYRDEFLKLLPQRFPRLPNLIPTRMVNNIGGVTTTYAFSRGMHCLECGRLSCRFKWEHWECSNCQFRHEVIGRLRTPKEFWNQRPSRGFLHSQIGKESNIVACRPQPIHLGAGKFATRLTFKLPHCESKIHLILGAPLSNADADKIFELYQQQASTGELKLRRYPLRNNSGEPYQYVGGTGNTVPFDEAPECVQRALALIKERSGLALGVDIPFNEILSAAYMERQKMAFHSDSEKGLGPVVASLSLGSAALMHFRLRMNAENPKSKNSYALTLALRHGDVLIMEGDGVQKYYEHTVVPMNFRIAATARCIGSV